MLNRLAAVETLVAQIEQNSAGRVQAYTERLYTRLKELLEDRNIDDARIVTEAAILADKTAIMSSKGEARRALKSNAIGINKEKVQGEETIIGESHLIDG